jgi:hypothetical protein
MESSVRRRRDSPRIFVTLAVAAAAAVLTTAVAYSLYPAPADPATPADVTAPTPASTQPAEPSHDPSLPSAAKIFEHPPARDDDEPSTF